MTEAAHGGLKPSPTGRLRRVLLHLSYSMALSHRLDTTPRSLLTTAACGGLGLPPHGWSGSGYRLSIARSLIYCSESARPKVPMRRAGADCSVIARPRRPQGLHYQRGWQRRGGHRSEGGRSPTLGVSQLATGGAPTLDGTRQPSFGGTSRMTRECQVRICERLRVKFPGPTRPAHIAAAKAPPHETPRTSTCW